MRVTELNYKQSILDTIEDRLGKLAQNDNLIREMVHYERGVIFGLMAAIAGLHLINAEEREDIVRRTDKISELKYRDIATVEARIQRN